MRFKLHVKITKNPYTQYHCTITSYLPRTTRAKINNKLALMLCSGKGTEKFDRVTHAFKIKRGNLVTCRGASIPLICGCYGNILPNDNVILSKLAIHRRFSTAFWSTDFDNASCTNYYLLFEKFEMNEGTRTSGLTNGIILCSNFAWPNRQSSTAEYLRFRKNNL